MIVKHILWETKIEHPMELIGFRNYEQPLLENKCTNVYANYESYHGRYNNFTETVDLNIIETGSQTTQRTDDSTRFSVASKEFQLPKSSLWEKYYRWERGKSFSCEFFLWSSRSNKTRFQMKNLDDF